MSVSLKFFLRNHCGGFFARESKQTKTREVWRTWKLPRRLSWTRLSRCAGHAVDKEQKSTTRVGRRFNFYFRILHWAETCLQLKFQVNCSQNECAALKGIALRNKTISAAICRRSAPAQQYYRRTSEIKTVNRKLHVLQYYGVRPLSFASPFFQRPRPSLVKGLAT